MLHYTLNPAQVIDTNQNRFKFNPALLDLLAPIVRQALDDEQSSIVAPLTALPEPLDSWKLIMTTYKGAAMFDVIRQTQILSMNGVAWTKEGASGCWECLMKYSFPVLDRLSIRVDCPKPPKGKYWLYTLNCVAPVSPVYRWLRCLEQCLGLVLIQESYSKANRMQDALKTDFGNRR